MRVFLIISVCLVTSGLAAGTTALDAVKLLPKEYRVRVARIEARDGSPVPERWYILVNDRAAESGLREFVVADGAIVAERGISQFAESLTPEQVIGDGVRFNSDRAAQLVQLYAEVNGVTVGTVAYQLRKDGPTAVPLWRLTCHDPLGRELGSLTITGTKGVVISHQGFAVEPAPVVAEKPREKLRTSAATQVMRDTTVQPAREPEPSPPKKPNILRRFFGGGKPAQQP
ncbi:MAG: hypothetical protein ABIZ56_11845 [Chthoniobacteraceae bacterium]